MLRWAIGAVLVLLGSALLWFLRPKREDEAARERPPRYLMRPRSRP